MPGATPMDTALHAVPTTRIVGGVGVVDHVGDWASTWGTRALVVLGDRHARASGLWARVEGALRSAGMVVELLEGVPSDPGVAIVDAGASLARAHRSDVVVAVGGGSVLDVAKAIAVAARGDGRSFRDHLSGARAVDLLVTDALPVVAVPTLPGSGSEANGTSVISDEVTGGKWSAHSELATPRVALVDPALLDDVPAELLGPGLVDGMCHALEAGLSTSASICSDAWAEQAVRMLRRDLAAACRADDGDLVALRLARQRCWWATLLAGQALTAAGSSVTHPLAHAVATATGARHGSLVAALEPAVLTTFGERFQSEGALARVARWFDVRGAATSQDPQLLGQGIVARLARACRDASVTASLAELGLVEDAFAEVVRAARSSGSRGLRSMPGGEPAPDDLFAVLDLALERGPASPARSWIEA